MKNSAGQSFYEIQLSNGSLIVAFLIAVGLGVSVFMLGVMVGRGQAPPPLYSGGLVESFGSASMPEGTAVDPDLEFFERVKDPIDDSSDGASSEPMGPQAPAADTTADSDAGEPAEAVAEPVSSPPQTSTPVRSTQARPTVAELPAGLPRADPEIPAGRGWVVQVKSTPTRSEADDLQTALAEAGFPAFVITAAVSGRATYRVRVGRYPSKADATAIEEALKARRYSTWVTDS